MRALVLLLALLAKSRGFFLNAPIVRGTKRAINHDNQILALCAIAHPERLVDVKMEHDALLADGGEPTPRLKELATVMRCVKALDEIHNDLALMQEHLERDDEKLKETAKVFTVEFKQCQQEIESQLNILLEGI